MYRRICSLLLLSTAFAAGCRSTDTTAVSTYAEAAVLCEKVLPVTGTFLNLAYQDVRNKYTNPLGPDNTDPALWRAKVSEMKKMGMEYLVLMAVANEGQSYYPSKLMPWVYNPALKSPVDAIMDAAAEHGMKVFMSTGWAKDQDDNLRDPKIKGRQIEMMTELAEIYGGHPALYGWYLPVEDCFGPVLTDYAVEAVNALTARARELTPHAKIMISPYGIFNSNFDDPRYEQQIARLIERDCKIDIVGLQMHLFNPQSCVDIANGANIQTPQGVRKMIENFKELKLPLHLSEITITSPSADDKGYMIQAIITQNLYRLWFSMEYMMGITWWNVVDNCGAKGEPSTSGLFFRDMREKPVYHAMNNLINNEWTTRLTIKADKQGKVSFRGFKGKYRITWTDKSGHEQSMEYNLE